MSAINMQDSFVSDGNLYQSRSAQAEAAVPNATETTTQSCAQALYGATQELWISMKVLAHMLFSKQTGPNLEIAYTLFADAVYHWESAYNSFTSSGGQPDPVSEAINTALNQTLSDGSSIYKLSQEVASNPANWQQLEEGVSSATLNSLFEDVDNWIDIDGAEGSVGFQPGISNSESNLDACIDNLAGYLSEPTTATLYYYHVFNTIDELNLYLEGQTGPICSCLKELFNTPFFQYDGKSYSLEDLAQKAMTPLYDTPTQIQEAEAALNSCLPVLKAFVNIANSYLNLLKGE